MQLLAAWKDSLMVFKPGNLKLFSLVTLNSLVKTYQVWLRYWGWLILASIGCAYYLPQAAPLVTIIIYITMFLSVRPSVKIKNWDYFMDYLPHAFYITVWKVATPWLFWLSMVALKMMITHVRTLIYAQLFAYMFLTVVFYLWINNFYTLLLFDSAGTLSDAVKNLFRAAKMFFYNLPFCIVITGLVIPLVWVGNYLVPNSPIFGLYILHVLFEFLILLPLFANIVTNFYVKKVHEQYSLYFGDK